MTDRVLPDADTITAAFATHEGPWGAGARVLSVRDLSTGLGQAPVLRASIATPYACPSLWIVKILGWGRQTLLDSRDRLLDRREAHFYGSSVPDLLPRGLTTPSGATVFRHHDRTWIVMRDVAAVLQQSWTPDATRTVSARAKELPATLVHGDRTPRNAGLDPHGALALIDWEHVGVGPVGYDLGTFVSLYRAFGGHGELDEPALPEVYGRAASELAGTDLRPAAALGFATAHLTWGIHLRLGPGLTLVRQGLNSDAPAALAAHLDDIRSGCPRALSWASAA